MSLSNSAKKILISFAVILLLAKIPPVFANVLGNPSFEVDIGSGTTGNWDATNGASRADAATIAGLGFAAPPDGSFVLRLQLSTDFTFQTYDNVHPGDVATFTGLATSDIAAPNGGEFRIEFRRVLPDDSDVLISAVNSTRINTTTAAGGVFTRFTVSGVAPAETGRVSFVLRSQGVDGNIVFDSVSGEVNPAKLNVVASKTRVKVGDAVTILANFQNQAGSTLSNVRVLLDIPRGLDLLPETIRLNNNTASVQEGNPATVTVGTVDTGQVFQTVFQVLVTSGVTAGKQYEIGVDVTNTSALRLSDHASVRLIVKGDPVFDEGTVIGKVFNDENQNGVQDKGEKGVPFVRLATEEGIVIITDENGKYSIPGVQPGRHVIKIDGHSLPQGTKFITEEAYLIKTTPGILNKVNFAVLLPPNAVPEQFRDELKVVVTQGLDTSRPVLNVRMEPDILRAGLGKFEKDPSFRFKINYPDFVKSWKLEIRDEMGRPIWTGFGVGIPPANVGWTGQTDQGLMIKPGLYSYQLKVQDPKDREDWTPLQFFRVISKADAPLKQTTEIEIPPVGDFNIFKDGKQSIPLVAKPTLRVQGKTKKGYKITVNSRPVPINSETGAFQTEFYTAPGEKEIVVSATSPEGETISYRETVKVRDSTFFAVALGEEQMGANFVKGRLESAGNDKSLKEGFYQDGRLSYYLRGKIKGKFLVKSHYDTSDKRSAIFTNLDASDYYPVYGDASTRDYEAHDTLQRFYLVVEMDRSYVKWGSFETNFRDTELASYNRSLSGFKTNIETTATTPYGDAKRGIKIFAATSQHRGAHDEFAATWGSLYYLRNRRVVEGSEKIRVEVRDKIQDMAISSTDLHEGTDYEIDYEEGRILLSRPLSAMGASDTLITRDSMDGSPVYLIVDYEFDSPPDVFHNKNGGIRGYTHVGDHLRIGATAIEEQRQNVDYDLRGVDAVLKLGRNSRISAEYAEAKHQQVNQSVSYNGGLSFRNNTLLPGRRPREGAFVIKAETKPMKNLETSGYIQEVQAGFSNEHIKSQEGLAKHGLAARYKITDDLSVRYRYDSNSLGDHLRPLLEHNVQATFDRSKTHVGQITYDDSQWLLQAEYMHQNTILNEPNASIDSLYSAFPFENVLAGKVGYHLNERLLPYAKVQTTVEGKPNHQFGGGVRYQVAKDMFAYMEEMIGNFGDSTYLGFEKMHDPRSRSYANVRMFDRGIGHSTLSTTIGSSYAFTEKSRVYSERENSTYHGTEGYADILGYEGKLGDHWDYDAKFARRHLDDDRTVTLDDEAEASLLRSNSSNTISGALGYANGKKLRARTSLEYRHDQDVRRLSQWVIRDSVEYQVNQDLSFLGRLDFGWSRFMDPDDTPAGFAEFSTGFAYRPVDFDRFNALMRYTYDKNIANDLQFQTQLFSAIPTDETSHIVAIDLAYDLFKHLGIVEKVAFKRGIFDTPAADPVRINQFLWGHRFNYHITRKWDIAAEYHILLQSKAADNFKHGFLTEVDRELYDYVRLGLGYNFSDFDDDLRSANDYDSHGPYVRLSGKF